MELAAVYRCIAALDVHQAKVTVCVLYETDHGDVVIEVREYGAFKRERREMAAWVASFQPELVVMEAPAFIGRALIPCWNGMV